MSTATVAAYHAFVRAYSDPESEQTRNQFESRRASYALRWHYYQNSIFEDLAKWGSYKGRYRLYRHTRSIYNPARRLVDFYAGMVYPGVLTPDAGPLPDGTQVAIPLNEDIPADLQAAIAQVWQWSNWQSGKALLVTYGASLGDVFAHVVDDIESGKAYPEVLWPGLISALDLDGRGNVQAYTIEYDYMGEDGRKYHYKRMVDRQQIRTFRDDAPYSYDDVPATTANPYGFVPAVWCKHTDAGGDHGEPAMRNLSKWDELNSLASHDNDQVHKILGAPILVSGQGIQRLADAQTKRGSTDTLTNPAGDMESLNLLQGQAGATMETVQLPQGEALERVRELIAEIEKDHPELTMYAKLREMSSVTGPGASRLFGDVESYVNLARANYDTQMIKLMQMTVAINGFRLNNGDWGNGLTRQQQVFQPFGLESYAAGNLDFSIQPRPLIQPTPMERAQMKSQELTIEMQEQSVSGEGMTRAQQEER